MICSKSHLVLVAGRIGPLVSLIPVWGSSYYSNCSPQRLPAFSSASTGLLKYRAIQISKACLHLQSDWRLLLLEIVVCWLVFFCLLALSSQQLSFLKGVPNSCCPPFQSVMGHKIKTKTHLN